MMGGGREGEMRCVDTARLHFEMDLVGRDDYILPQVPPRPRFLPSF